MKKPWIGINCSTGRSPKGSFLYQLDRRYVDAVRKAGGVPVLMPFFATRGEAEEFLGRIDGVLLTGGPDLNPRRWRAPLHPKAELLDPVREGSDFLSIAAALKLDKPTLGICLGCQLFNVASGGTLHQHIPDLKREGAVEHSDGSRHGVTVERPSRLSTIVRRRSMRVLSWHHQAIDRVGRGLRVAARSEDGLVEAVESPEHRFAVGVQWHPERMTGDGALFEALVGEAARK